MALEEFRLHLDDARDVRPYPKPWKEQKFIFDKADWIPLYPVTTVLLYLSRIANRSESDLALLSGACLDQPQHQYLAKKLSSRIGALPFLKKLPDSSSCLKLLTEKKVDYIFIDSDIAQRFVSVNPEYEYNSYLLGEEETIRIVGQKLKTLDVSLTLKWGIPDYLDYLNEKRLLLENKSLKNPFRQWFNVSLEEYLGGLGTETKFGLHAPVNDNILLYRQLLANYLYELQLSVDSSYPPTAITNLIKYYSRGDPYLLSLDYLEGIWSKTISTSNDFESSRFSDLLASMQKVNSTVFDRFVSFRLGTEGSQTINQENWRKLSSYINKNFVVLDQISFLKKQIKRLIQEKKEEDALTLVEKILLFSTKDAWATKTKQELLTLIDQKREERIRSLEPIEAIARARDFFQKAKFDEALDEIDRALFLDKKNTEAEKLRQVIFLKRLEQKKIFEAERVSTLLGKGIVFYNTGRYDVAVSTLEECLKMAPQNSTVLEYLELARGALRTDRDENLQPHSPYYSIVYQERLLALNFFNLGQRAFSLEYWKKILFLLPKNREASIYASRCYRDLNPAIYSQIINDKIVEIRNEMARKNLLNAEHLLGALLQIDNTDSKVQSIQKEFEAIKNALFKKPKDTTKIQGFYDQAISAYNDQNYSLAETLWKSIILEYPDEVQAKVFLSRIETLQKFNAKEFLVQENDTEKQIREFQIQGMTYYNSGKLKEAILEWQKILKLQPDDRRALSNIKRARSFLEYNQ
jgi:tetratricopeptide (TPR) repeat protein